LALSGCGTVKEVSQRDQTEYSVQDTLSHSAESVEEVPKQDEVIAEEVLKQNQKIIDAPAYLLLAQKLLEKGHFEASLDASQKSLSHSANKSPGDESLFHMGLIFAHYNNPKKDYKKSISYFERILRDYPHSPLTEQAKIWIAVLNMVEQSKRVDIQIEEMKKELLQN
jgi:tetratricopeptide (TPR) repeat protein